MKNFLSVILVAFCICSCSADMPDGQSVATGNVYGVVTVKSTAEPMRGTGVELYYDNALLLKTVTYDDGHYEFVDLKAGTYELRVVAEGYADVKFSVIVEAGRTARADMQLNEIYAYMTVRTLDVTDISGNKATLNGAYTYRGSNAPDEVGFFYATHHAPISAGTRITTTVQENFSISINDLTEKDYYVQAYARNARGVAYGEQRIFHLSGDPIVSTLAATNVDAAFDSATLNGRIEYKGVPNYTERGFVYSNTFEYPSIDDNPNDSKKIIVPGDSLEFSANITWSSWYWYGYVYVRAYAKNEIGTVYGESVKFRI